MTFSSNFQFIEPCSQQLAELGKNAERLYALNEPIPCLVSLRTYTEFLVELVTVELGIYVPEVSLIDRLRRIEAVFHAQKANIAFILEKLHTLRIDGNRAVHNSEGDSQTAAANLRIAYEMGIWYCRAFRHVESSPPAFELPKLQPDLNIPQTQDLKSTEEGYQDQLEQMRDEIERLNREAQVKKAKGSENLALSIHQAKEATDLIRAMITDTEHGNELNSSPEWSEGFDHTADLFQNAELVLRQISALIGERSSEPIELLSGESILPGLGLVNDATALIARADDIHQGVFKLIVIGEFKHGKSTLLNAMLGGKVLPVSAVPATAVITMLVAGDNQRVEIYDVGKEQPRVMSLEAFNQEFRLTPQDIETINRQGFLDRFQNIQYAKIECQHGLCSQGVRLIDSPGLAEQSTRTKVATNFFEQSQAAIFVLYAKQQLGEGEREFIKTHFKPGFIDHVFFVVNQIDLIDEDEVESVKDYFRVYLKDYFLDAVGQPDLEKCNKHLFFTNAKTAFKARQSNPVNHAELEASGVLDLEKRLEGFLTGADKVRAGLSSTFKLLVTLLYEADVRIEFEKAALEQSLADLEQRRGESEIRLQALEKKKEDIQETIRLYSEVIAAKLCSNLEQYVGDMNSLWSTEAYEYITIELFNPLNMARALVDGSAKERLKRTTSSDVQRYLEAKFRDWADKASVVVEAELEKFSVKLEAEVATFAKELSNIENLFSGELFHVSSTVEDISKNRGDKILQLAVGLAMMDFSGLVGTLMGRGNWGSFVQAAIIQAALGTFIFSMFQGPVGIVAFVFAEIVQFVMNQSRHEQEIIKSIGKKVNEELINRSSEMRFALNCRTKEAFWNLSDKLTQTLQQQIDEVRTEQERILSQKRSRTFSIDQEKLRMERIGDELVQLFNTLSKATYNKTYTLEQLKWLATGKKVLGEN
ncbi:MAG TPA: dynamin family protein [Oculatellaceae cyanobacterium]|jgi:GTPase SAR1 family protein